MKDKLVIILGPTASGKTDLSIAIAQALNGEIISGDSMQVYRKMDIGTAKITESEQKGIVHHLINIINPDQEYSVADFKKASQKLIKEINHRGKLPIVVGGTGLYISSLVNPYLFPQKSSKDEQLRSRLQEEYQKDRQALYQRLQQIDPQAAQKIHPNDGHRLVRALEVYEKTGQTISRIQAESQKLSFPCYKMVMIGLSFERTKLYQRINQRVDLMIEAGLVEEVERLLAQGYNLNQQAMQGLGYKQIARYLLGEMSLETAITELKRDTRRFAKRQITWFKRDQRIKWFDIELPDLKEAVISEIRRDIGED
ncbi:MAG: tRNA (adenosine(37)-N6)-dimethylallyltransferase MiaA [Bacillota bacterium]